MKPQSWVQRVMQTSDATTPPKGVFTRDPETIADAADVQGVAPKGLTSWQRMVLFHRNRSGKGLTEERREALGQAIKLLSQRRQERIQQLNGFQEGTLLPRDMIDPQDFALRLGKEAAWGLSGAMRMRPPTQGPSALRIGSGLGSSAARGIGPPPTPPSLPGSPSVMPHAPEDAMTAPSTMPHAPEDMSSPQGTSKPMGYDPGSSASPGLAKPFGEPGIAKGGPTVANALGSQAADQAPSTWTPPAPTPLGGSSAEPWPLPFRNPGGKPGLTAGATGQQGRRQPQLPHGRQMHIRQRAERVKR